MTKRTIAIIGGTGFVGRHLAQELVQLRNTRVRVFTRNRERNKELIVIPGVSVEEVNVQDEFALTEALGGVDAVVNLVGILNERGHSGRGFRHAHVDLTRRLLTACRENGIRRLLHMSALGADAENGRSHYQRTKGEAENLVMNADGMEVTAFRPSVIFGRGDSFLNRFAGLLRISPILPLAGAWARFQPIYVNDVVAAFVHALDDRHTIGQRYDLCGPHTYTLQELVRYVGEQTGHERPIIPLGKGLSWLQAAVLEWVPGKPFSLDNYRSLLTDNVCEGDFPAVFGFQPTTLE
jgi:NADH dehydrogenase